MGRRLRHCHAFVSGGRVTTQSNIVATCFGGAGDRETSAYGGIVDPTCPGVALPFHFSGVCPKVMVMRNGVSVACDVVDVGPHNTNDPYWAKNARPLAESATGNKAGIDMTPAVFAALGIVPSDPQWGLTVINWQFADLPPAAV
jgi:hypothetical protein